MIKIGSMYIDKAVLFVGLPWILLCFVAFVASLSVYALFGGVVVALVIFSFRDVFFRSSND